MTLECTYTGIYALNIVVFLPETSPVRESVRERKREWGREIESGGEREWGERERERERGGRERACEREIKRERGEREKERESGGRVRERGEREREREWGGRERER